MLFQRLDVDDGASWRATLREAWEPAPLAEARRQARDAVADGADPLDVAMCLWASALTWGETALARASERDFLALCLKQPPSLATARELFAVAIDAVQILPRTGPLIRALEATLAAAGLTVDELVAAIDEVDEDHLWAARYLVARLQVRAAGGPRAPTALVRTLEWEIVSVRLRCGGGIRREIVSSLIMRILRRVDFDDCATSDRVHLMARWLDGLGPPPGTRWAGFTSADAAPLLRRVLEHWQKHHCARAEWKVSVVLTDLAAIVRDTDPIAAEDLYRNSLIVARQVEGDGSQVQVTEAHLAGLMVDVKRFDEAIEILESLIPRRVALLGRASEGVYVSTIRLAEALLGLGRLDEAERAARDAFAISQEARFMSIESRDIIADILEARGRSDEADIWRDWHRAREVRGIIS